MPATDIPRVLAQWKPRVAVKRLYRDYYDGRHPIQFASKGFKDRYQWVLQSARENLCEAVVDAFVGPMSVTSWNGAGATRATELATTLGLSRLMNQVHDESWIAGDGYLLVWPNRNGIDYPFYHAASDMVVLCYGGTNEMELAAKFWLENKKPRVNLYYSDRCERWYAPASTVDGEITKLDTDWPNDPEMWAAYNLDAEGEVIRHTKGEVPVGWFAHGQAAPGKPGTSVLRNVVPLQDGLNHSLASLIVGSEAFSQPLRLLLGMEESEDKVVSLVAGELQIQDRQKLSIDPTRDSIVKVPGEKTRAHQFDPPDATKLVAVQDAFAAKMSRVVGLPPFDISPDLGNVPSGSALRVLRERKSSNIGDFLQDVTPEWSKVMRLLGVPDVQPEWAEVSPLDPLEKLQLIQAKHAIGYPLEELLRDFGEGPEDITRITGAILAQQATAAAEALRQLRTGGQVEPLP